VDSETLAIGLTGSFGSGCSTLAEGLASMKAEDKFTVFSLSTILKNEWKRAFRTTAEGEREPVRRELQDYGDQLRALEGRDVLARKAIELAGGENGGSRIVFDSIRNLGEVDLFRQSFARFFVVAVQCYSEMRWKRVEKRYKALGLGYDEFRRDDIRDQIESDLPNGQQVQLCVDAADIVLTRTLYQWHSTKTRRR